MMPQKHFSGCMSSQMPGLQKSRNILPILLHNILLQYRRNTNTLPPSVQVTIQLNVGAAILSPEGHLHPQTQLYCKYITPQYIHVVWIHKTNMTHTQNSQMMENTETKYIRLLGSSQEGKKLLSFCKKYYQIRSIQTWQLTIYV